MIENVEAIKASVSIDKIIGQYVELRPDGHHLLALCPFHQEKTPSFTVTPDKAMYKCFGCDVGGDVFSFVQEMEKTTFAGAVKLVAEMSGISVIENSDAPVKTMPPQNGNGVHKPFPPAQAVTKPASTALNEPKPKLVATYPYTTVTGELCYEVLRYEPGKNGKKKDFRQRRPFRGSWAWGLNAGWYQQSERGDWYPTSKPEEGAVELSEVDRVLWKLPELVATDEAFVVEGERDVQTMNKLGFVATTVSGGSKQPWTPEYSEALRSKRVVIFPDNDAPGEAHGRKIEHALKNIASEIVYVQMPKGFKDVTDYVESGRSGEDVKRLVSNAELEVIEADQRRRGLLSPWEAITRSAGGLKAFLDPRERPKGQQTGFIQFDEMTLGLHDEQLIIIAGRPSSGKTTLGINWAHNIARQRKRSVAVFSLEMGTESLLDRMACSAASLDSLRFRSGYASPHELDAFRDAMADINELPIYFDDYTPLTLEEMERKLDLFSRENYLGLVVLDYLSLMSVSKASKAGNRVNEVSEQARGLKLFARKYKCPFVVLAQLSRACEVRPGDHRPILSDLRESGGVEENADVVGFVYRQEMYRPDLESARGIAELIIAKQRSGPTGTAKFKFMRRFNRFDNLDYDSDQAYGSEA